MASPEIVIVGAGGRLGAALWRTYGRDHSVRGVARRDLDLGEEGKLRETLEDLDFNLLINAAAMTNVDRCETDREEAFAVNATAPRIMAETCRAKKARLIHISTDYVFDGKQREPYREQVPAKPLSVYGASKLAGENEVLAVQPEAIVARVSWVFGPDRPSFVDNILARARTTAEVSAVSDKYSTPTYTLDLAQWLKQAWEAELKGVVHFSNAGACSWQEYAQHALDCCREQGIAMAATRVGALPLQEMTNFVARRPVYTVLNCDRFRAAAGVEMRDWREAVADYIRSYYR